MKGTRLAQILAVTVSIWACGVGSGSGIEVPNDPNAPLIQIRSEGGFAPVEVVLGRGPTYTLLADGRLIYEGPTIAIYPGRLVPNYQMTRATEGQMAMVLDLAEEIGLADMDSEIDDSASSRVADATTEVVTYWDANGAHSYAVYALGVDIGASLRPETAAFADLLMLLGDITSGDAQPFQAERVQVIAGPGLVNEEFPDARAWPLADTDLSQWETLQNGWQCSVQGPEVIEVFANATQATVWADPDPTTRDQPLKLLVRPLHPGETPCPTS